MAAPYPLGEQESLVHHGLDEAYHQAQVAVQGAGLVDPLQHGIAMSPRSDAALRHRDYELFVNVFLHWDLMDLEMRLAKPYMYGFFLYRVFLGLYDHIMIERFGEVVRVAAVQALQAASSFVNPPKVNILKTKLRNTKISLPNRRKVYAVPFCRLRRPEEIDPSNAAVRELCQRVGINPTMEEISRHWDWSQQWLDDNAVEDPHRIRREARNPEGIPPEPLGVHARVPPRKKLRPSPFAPRSNVSVLASGSHVVSVDGYTEAPQPGTVPSTNPIPIPFRLAVSTSETKLRLALPGDLALYHCAPSMSNSTVTVQLVYPSDTANAAVNAGVAPQTAVWSIPLPFRLNPAAPAKRWNDTVLVDATSGTEVTSPQPPGIGTVRPVSRWAFWEFDRLQVIPQHSVSPAPAYESTVEDGQQPQSGAAAPPPQVQYLPRQFGAFPPIPPGVVTMPPMTSVMMTSMQQQHQQQQVQQQQVQQHAVWQGGHYYDYGMPQQ